MSVPEEIRKVERPKNTVVVDSGKNGVKRYSVYDRRKSVCKSGHNPQPRNGKVIGHIIDGKFVPVSERTAEQGPQILSYGSSAFFKSVSDDITDDLMKIYSPGETYAIMSIAAARIIRPAIPNGRVSVQYGRSFISKYYPGAPISKNSVSTLLEKLGMDFKKRREFYKLRIDSVAEKHHIAIDGMLKSDESVVNDFSSFSYKSKLRGRTEISMIYAYDIELMEPVCAEVYPGNFTDASVFSDFVKNNNLDRGIIVADKGFPANKIKDELSKNETLHYLLPMKRNDIRIKQNDMLRFDAHLKTDSSVLCKKTETENGFLYSFKDISRSADEEKDFLKRAENEFDGEEYERKKKSFGTIVFESDQDLNCDAVYQCYRDRWLLELIFRHYKNENYLGETRVQNDYSVIGSEFVNFIATLVSGRMVKALKKTGLLEKDTFGNIVEDLGTAWRIADAPNPPRSDDGHWIHVSKGVFAEMELLGLSVPNEEVHSGMPGRPRKILAEPAVKRPRGRPRKSVD